MVNGVELLQAFARHVRVDLGRRNVTVSEQHLHDPQVGAVVQQVGGKSMAQRVRGERAGYLGGQRVAFDQVPECLPRHAGATRGQEGGVRQALPQQQRSRLGEIAL